MITRDHARIALAAIRLVNGTMALLTPEMMLRRLGADPAANQVAIYPLRMFGIRTVVLGVDLLAGGPMQQKGQGRRRHPRHGRGVGDHRRAAAATARAGRPGGGRNLPDKHRASGDYRAAGADLPARRTSRPPAGHSPDGWPVPTTASADGAAEARARYGQ